MLCTRVSLCLVYQSHQESPHAFSVTSSHEGLESGGSLWWGCTNRAYLGLLFLLFGDSAATTPAPASTPCKGTISVICGQKVQVTVGNGVQITDPPPLPSPVRR